MSANERPEDLPEDHQTESLRPLKFEDLAQGQLEIAIEFNGQLYRLRATRNGKLILNK